MLKAAQGVHGAGWQAGASPVCLFRRPLRQKQQGSRALWHSLTYGAHVVPMAVPVESSTEAGVKGFAPHIAEFCATLLKGDTEVISIKHAGAVKGLQMPQQTHKDWLVASSQSSASMPRQGLTRM